MERKLATVLFVDIVDSTQLVTGTDPEVVRRRVSRFFETVSSCIEQHGGIVEKFAGDAVMAAFGVPQTHEDDALRAMRAALAMREGVGELGLEARVGIEAGELVVEDAASTFATGEAVNLAARLQQSARPGEILVGPTAYRLASGSILVEDAGPLDLKGVQAPLRGWRLVDVTEGARKPLGPASPLVGRDAELELLANTFTRTARTERAHLFTIFGEPGIGKSRLAREFVDGLERASVLTGRCLPYGEGVTYWPLAEMIKAAAGIADDDPLEEAFEKLRVCCAEEAVADVLGLASGMLEALESEQGVQEISWAARDLLTRLADVQPLVLVFEDIHWAEPPLLDVIEYLADSVRAPLLIVCLSRPELLDSRVGWGGGRVRSTAIELEPLSDEESESLVGNLVTQFAGATGELLSDVSTDVLQRAEGNPLFVEETIRMLLEGGTENGDRVPDTLQALIAARIDYLAPDAKTLLQRAAVIGRVFWKGALEYLSPDVSDTMALLEDLLQRDLLLREPRSSVSGETAFRFKHLLIREVAYAGLTKHSRAQHHARFADWLAEHAGDELIEIRAYHLDLAVELLAELDGAPPAELADTAAAALVKAGRRAMAREAYSNARRLGLRALELHPTLDARYVAARAAWRLQDWGAVRVEMEKTRDQARDEGATVVQALALTALAEAALKRDGDAAGAKVAVDEALELLAREPDPVAQFEALSMRAIVAAWLGSHDDYGRFMERAYTAALEARRKDLQTIAAQALAQARMIGLDLDEAELLITRALELAGESGSVRARISATLAYGWFLRLNGELDAAETVVEEVRVTAEELNLEPVVSAALVSLGWIARRRGDLRRAEKLFREATRLTSGRGDRGLLPDYNAALATTLADLGKVDEAERLALDAAAHAVQEDTSGQVFMITALASVRAAQGRDTEAEELFVEAIDLARASDLELFERHPLEQLVRFLHGRGREDEAAPYEARLVVLALPGPESTARIA